MKKIKEKCKKDSNICKNCYNNIRKKLIITRSPEMIITKRKEKLLTL